MNKIVLIIIAFLIICSNLFAQVGGNALQFDGIDDYVEISRNPSLLLSTHMTIEMWVKPAEINRRQYLWRQPGNWWTLRIDDTGHLVFYFDSELISSTSLTNTDAWYHFACTDDQSKLRIYINGIASGEQSFSGIGGNNDGPFQIGYESEEATAYKGLIDEVRVWNIARSQKQIQSTMNDTLPPTYYSESSDSGMVAYWRFDEAAGVTTFDLTSNHNDGLINGPTFVPSDALVKVEELVAPIPNTYFLGQNYPNPFNPSTNIVYSIPTSNVVKLIIYDLLGNELQILINEFQKSGSYSIQFDASELASGVYFYSLYVGSNFVKTKKMLFLR